MTPELDAGSLYLGESPSNEGLPFGFLPRFFCPGQYPATRSQLENLPLGNSPPPPPGLLAGGEGGQWLMGIYMTVTITSVEFSIRCFIDIVKMHKTMANDRGLYKKRYPWKRMEPLEKDRGLSN